MPTDKTIAIDYAQSTATAPILPCPPVLSSYQTGWQNIRLAHYQLPPWEIPEIASPQHTIVLAESKQPTKTEFRIENKLHLITHDRDRLGNISIFPTEVPLSCSWDEEVEFTHLYLEPSFLTQVAYESVNPDRVDIALTLEVPDPLVRQIGMAMKNVLEQDPSHSCLYAESMATALAAHFLQYHSTHTHVLREYSGGLPKAMLRRAIEYMNEYLNRDISLVAIAAELNISQYHFCRLFKQSIGLTPHQYLIQQRIKRSQKLLKQPAAKILNVAIECGFSSPSHFAKCFRRQTGISPKQFRMR